MNDYTEIYPGLCVGAAPNDWYSIWEDFDVIVSLCSVGITPLPSGKMRVSWFIDDWEAPEDVNHLWGLVGLIVKLVRDGERVCIHCGAGLNRSGLVAALAYRELTNCGAAEAEDHIKATRSGALSNPYFLTFIRALDGKIDGDTTTFRAS